MTVDLEPFKTPMIPACGQMMESAMSRRVCALQVPTAQIAAIAAVILASVVKVLT